MGGWTVKGGSALPTPFKSALKGTGKEECADATSSGSYLLSGRLSPPPKHCGGAGFGAPGLKFPPPTSSDGVGLRVRCAPLQAAPLRSLSSSSGQAMTRQKGLGEVGVWAAAAAARAGGGAAGNPAGVRGG